MEFTNKAGIVIVRNIIKNIEMNKDHLGEIDRFVGDGDHGSNLNKGMKLADRAIDYEHDDMSEGFNKIYKELTNKIGGSIGPLLGYFFKGLASASKDSEFIDGCVTEKMLLNARDSVAALTEAKVGDKTIMDVLIPAVNAYQAAYDTTHDFEAGLNEMSSASKEGLESTKNLIAKYGRGRRLGDLVIGHQDSGAASLNIMIQTFAETAKQLINK